MIDDVAPNAARLVCGVLERDPDETEAALTGLSMQQLKALAVLLAASVDPEQPLGRADRVPPYIGTVARIVSTTSWYTGMDPALIYSRDRNRDVTDARQIVCWVAAAQGLRMVQIGKALHRDHTSVMNAVDKVTRTPAMLKVARKVQRDVEAGISHGT